MLPILLKDGYKASHKFQYPIGTEFIYSNFTPRSNKHGFTDKVVFFGLQAFIKKYLIDEFNNNFFKRNKQEVLKEYKGIMDSYLGCDYDISHISELHDLGYLPLKIKALPEGSRVGMGVPLLTIINTNPKFFWLTNFLETLLSCEMWGAITSATTAYTYREIYEKYAKLTGGDRGFIPFQGHDFSMRGMFGAEASTVSGGAHLTSFYGSDTIPSIYWLRKYYKADGMISTTVPASEHSVVSVGGKEDEQETFRRLIEDIYPNGIVSLVSDTYDLWKVLTEYLPNLKDKVMSRNGKVVIRPDCYDDKTEIYTNSGWKFFSELNENDLVAQITDKEEIEFVSPLKIYAEHYKGDMFHFKDHHGKLDLLVTPNHRMIYKKKNEWFVQNAEDANGYYDKDFLRSAKQKDGFDITPFERFMIAYQADGSKQSNIPQKEGFISGLITYRFNFAKERKIERLLKICEDANLQVSVHSEKSRIGQKTIYVRVPLGKQIPDKEFSWVNPQSRGGNWCRSFIEELSYWDSTRRSDSRFKYDSTIQQASEVVAEVALLAGYGATCTTSSDERSEMFSDVHTVHIMKDNRIGGQSHTKELVNYDGMIYCVQVPTGRLLIKRNRCTIVCGNSGNPADIVCGKKTRVFGNHIEASNYFRNNISNRNIYKVGNEYFNVMIHNGSEFKYENYNPKPEDKGAIDILWENFGGTINDEGFKLLDPHVGLIYGDGITRQVADEILCRLMDKGFASTNIVFGQGSFSYCFGVSRDTFGHAVKATWGQIKGESKDIFKDPITDNGLKKSAKGLLRVDLVDGEYKLKDQCTKEEEQGGCLETVFLDGKLIKETTLQEIRERLWKT